MSTTDSNQVERSASPSALGFRMPAEWESHRATWVSWPHNEETWPGKFETIEPAFSRVVRAIAKSEPVFINVLGPEHEEHVHRYLVGVEDGVRFFHIPTNDAWCRDHGPTFLTRSNGPGRELAGVKWEYNAWGGKYPPYDLDNAAGTAMCEAIGVPVFRSPLVAEGGALETNGRGLLLTTESCLTNPNRNPGITRGVVERELKQMLGMRSVVWLPGGDLAGDDTDGHVDNIARFVSDTTIVIPSTDDPDDPNYETLKENGAALDAYATPRGALRVVKLPVPTPVFYDGRRLPASYANFLVANTVVIVPTYRCPEDADAIDILSQEFPGRCVVAIDCTDLVWGLGAIHCLTQQVPA